MTSRTNEVFPQSYSLEVLHENPEAARWVISAHLPEAKGPRGHIRSRRLLRFYSKFYGERRAFHYLVDVKLFNKMRKRLGYRPEDLLTQSLNRPARSKTPITPQKELDIMWQEFKLLVEVPVDFYDCGQLHHFLDPDNSKTFLKFGVKCTTLNDIIIPFSSGDSLEAWTQSVPSSSIK